MAATTAQTTAERDPVRDQVPLPIRHRFSVSDYYRMAESGILAPDERVELLDGEVVLVSPIGQRHAAAVRRLLRVLSMRAATFGLVDVQNPIRLNDRSEPQPDVMLLRPRDDLYSGAHPGPGDVLLVIEVMERSANVDRRVKLPLYARAGIPELWLVELSEVSPAMPAMLEVHRRPSGGAYAQMQRLEAGRGASIGPLLPPQIQLSVDELLG